MKWIFKKKIPKKFINQFPEYSPLVLRLLYHRGLKTQAQIEEFFYPDYARHLHDPFLMKDMDKAVKRIIKALKRKEKVVIFGDYDCDGICSALILETALRALGINNLEVYIPDRHQEGYGLNTDVVYFLSKKKIDLIITVDCGVSDFEEIKLAQELGIEVIIFDHHIVPKKLPPAVAIVDPWQKGDKYPFKELAAVGVVFKFIQALTKVKEWKEKEGWEKWLLDLVALATVSDCMPLLGENRILVKYGLVVLAQSRRKGLRELLKISRVDKYGLNFNKSKIGKQEQSVPEVYGLDTYTLGYILGPRINSASRIESHYRRKPKLVSQTNVAYDLLASDNKDEVKRLAEYLDKKNKERQDLVNQIVKEIEEKIDFNNLPKFIFVGHANWPIGILGLIAGKLSEKFFRPVIIFQKGDNECRGSARSIPQLNITEVLSSCQNFLKEFGGHSGAAGFIFSTENLENFQKCLRKIIHQKLAKKKLEPALLIDSSVNPEEVDWFFYDQLQWFNPFGRGNERPLFLIRNLKVIDKKTVGNNGRHLKLIAQKDSFQTNKQFKIIGFDLANNGNESPKIKIGDRIDLVFELIANEWNGFRELQFKAIDLKIKNISG